MATLKFIRLVPKQVDGKQCPYILSQVVIAETGEPITGVQEVSVEASANHQGGILSVKTVDFSVSEVEKSSADYENPETHRFDYVKQLLEKMKVNELSELLRFSRPNEVWDWKFER